MGGLDGIRVLRKWMPQTLGCLEQVGSVHDIRYTHADVCASLSMCCILAESHAELFCRDGWFPLEFYAFVAVNERGKGTIEMMPRLAGNPLCAGAILWCLSATGTISTLLCCRCGYLVSRSIGE